MSQGKKLVECMLLAGQAKPSEMVDMVVGKVTSVEPLKVKLDKIELTETFLIVGALCKEMSIPFDTNGHSHQVSEIVTSSADSHTHKVAGHTTESTFLPDKIVLWRGLQVGDTVYMLKLAKGQKYYIIQREEIVANDT